MLVYLLHILFSSMKINNIFNLQVLLNSQTFFHPLLKNINYFWYLGIFSNLF